MVRRRAEAGTQVHVGGIERVGSLLADQQTQALATRRGDVGAAFARLQELGPGGKLAETPAQQRKIRRRIDRQVNARHHQFALMLLSRTTLPQLSHCSAMSRENCSGVIAGVVMVVASSRSFTDGTCMTAATSWLSRRTIGSGVPAGA